MTPPATPDREADDATDQEEIVVARYEVLHYRGDLTHDALPGVLLGFDELGRRYEVLDAEYDAEIDRTTVHLQYATEETLRTALGSAA